MENKIYFLGKSKDFALAEKLFDLVSCDLAFEHKVAVVEKDFEASGDFDAVAYEFGTDIKKNTFPKTYTYSVGQSNADVCGFNFLTRETSKSLDLFSGSFMGRVNIPVNSQFTEKAVLYCVTGFVAAGVSLPQVLKAINSKIS